MCLWECVRVARRAAGGRLARRVTRPRKQVHSDLERLEACGLVVRRPRISRTGGSTWSVAGEPIIVTVPHDGLDAHRASIDGIRSNHCRYFDEVLQQFGMPESDPARTLRLNEHRLARVGPEDLHELRRRMHAVFDYLELIASRRSGQTRDQSACNHAIRIEVRPIDGPVLPLPSHIRLHAPDDAADAHGSPAEVATALTPGEAPRKRALSRREEQVAEALAGGLTRTELAQALGITTNTVGTLLKRVYAKLGVHHRAELATVMANRHRA
jgi:DNA-binding CsgD family transcriptional regulator